MTNAYLPYTVTELFCCVFIVVLLFHLNSSMGSEHEVLQLKYLACFYLVAILPDVFWAMTNDHVIDPPHILNAAVNTVSTIGVALGCFQWFWFVLERLKPDHEFSKRSRILIALPLIFVCAADAISIFTNWLFYIDASNIFCTTELFDIIQPLGTFTYLIAAAVLSFAYYFKEYEKLRRIECLRYSVLMLPVMLAEAFTDKIPTVPITALSIFFMLYLLFLMLLDMQIFYDTLTGLNNRRCLMQYLGERIKAASEEHPVTVFMLDINSFKSINDNYGHVEGDRALRKFAQVMKKTAERYAVFAARYGGDEFCFVEDGKKFDPDELLNGFQEILRDIQEKEKTSYEITASAGYAVCSSAEKKPDAIVDSADIMLYLKKREWHKKKTQNRT
ncbi:MAG TPA: GGDEF domain-containing protein [Lachnospiraceae bacterium]|nr:GGDEF domain-containing protein [Lachnospiraceae bacterium]